VLSTNVHYYNYNDNDINNDEILRRGSKTSGTRTGHAIIMSTVALKMAPSFGPASCAQNLRVAGDVSESWREQPLYGQ
jgi:hypothetical protein